MNLEVGQQVLWTPRYFKWDVERQVTVTRVYRDGGALLSNGLTVEKDGFCEWHRRLAGSVAAITKQEEITT